MNNTGTTDKIDSRRVRSAVCVNDRALTIANNIGTTEAVGGAPKSNSALGPIKAGAGPGHH